MNQRGLINPKNIFLLGYGAVGKCFAELLLKNFKNINLTVCDRAQINQPIQNFKYIQKTITKENITSLATLINKGDIFIDLSCDIDVLQTWEICMKKGVNYLNTSMENWKENDDLTSYPKSLDEMYQSTEGNRYESVSKLDLWNKRNGTSSVFEFGMNPGLISHLVKKGIVEAAVYFLNRDDFDDLNKKKIEFYLQENNFPKLAQELGLHTIHSTEKDTQYLIDPPKDTKTKLYNTWSCRGLITEQMVPIQVARGSHEDPYSEDFPRLKNGTIISSWGPAYLHTAKSWVPFENYIGRVAPHGEAYSLRKFFSDEETGYAPSQYFIYGLNPYTKDYIENLPLNATIKSLNPEMEILHNQNNKLKGYNKVGALLIFSKNRAWWCGSIFDEFDASMICNHKYNPTVIQVAAGAFSGMLWLANNPNAGNKFSEDLDTDFIIEKAKPYLGRILSDFVDLSQTDIMDCFKFESFLNKQTFKKMVKRSKINNYSL